MAQLVFSLERGLFLEGTAESAAEKKLAFSTEPAVWLRLLATDLLAAEVEPPWRWLRELAQEFFSRLCQTGQVTDLPAPSPEEIAMRLAAAPPFPGVEQVTAETLIGWWRDLAVHLTPLIEAAGGVEAWLRQVGPDWHVVGRVTFHLAENKADTQRPFAFLATYAESLGAAGQPQHRPLARALQRYAGGKDEAALNRLLEPVRSAAQVSSLLRGWLESKRLFQPMALSLREAYQVLRETASFQKCGIVMKLPDWWHAGRSSRPMVKVTLEVPQRATFHAGALLKFQIERSLDGELLTEEEWQRLLSADTGLVSLRGRWVEVDAEQLTQVLSHWQKVQAAAGENGIGFLDGMRLLAGWNAKRAAVEDAGLAAVPEWSQVVAGEKLSALIESMRQPEAVDPPSELRAVLRPYQRQGYAWLHFMTKLGLGACLADDMGLGKTLQVLALLLRRKREVNGPALLVVPASLVGNWKAEAERFAPDLRLCVAHPSALDRDSMTQLVKQPGETLCGWDVMITTYALLQRTESWRQQTWSLVVLDEAQAIKNPGSGAAKAVKQLRAPARVALTGTPVENRPGDLWSLMDFLNPGLLGNASDFALAVKRCVQSPRGYAPLRRLVQPYLLRRMKTDRSIIRDLPDKIELAAFCGLTRRQATLYAKLVDQLARQLADKDLEPIRRQGLVLGSLMQFKQICNHPSHWSGDGLWLEQDSGKFIRLKEIAAELAERRERALVFTQFQEMCEPIARLLASAFGREGLVLHGGTPVAKRSRLVDAFQQSDGPPFMVVSVKAGGAGLTLTAASHVIHFDRWWNPAVENQATDRAFRIGQTQTVVVHKFICQGTLEERIDALISQKQTLADDLLTGDTGLGKQLNDMAADELLELVRLDVRALTE